MQFKIKRNVQFNPRSTPTSPSIQIQILRKSQNDTDLNCTIKQFRLTKDFIKWRKMWGISFLLSCPLRTWVNMALKSFRCFVAVSNNFLAFPTNPYSAIHLTSFLGRLFAPFLFSFRLHYVLWVLNSLSTLSSLRPSNFNCLIMIPSTNERNNCFLFLFSLKRSPLFTYSVHGIISNLL